MKPLASHERYSRQMRLGEVGAEGQSALARARLRVAAGQVGLVEAMYLQRAGVNRLTITSLARRSPFPHADAFRFEASRSFAEGAWSALATIRNLIRPEST